MLFIEKLIQQICLQKDSEDPDPASALAAIDVKGIMADITDTSKYRESEEKYRKQLEKSRRLERELEGYKLASSKDDS